MMILRSYELIQNGFQLKLDLRLYAREATIKALYRFHDRFIISYEIEDNLLVVSFETSVGAISVEDEVRDIMKELDFQMIRYDVSRSSAHIRELLVARALYATCIEPERESINESDAPHMSGWQEDQSHIFSSWDAER